MRRVDGGQEEFEMRDDRSLRRPELFLNRELSWLEFNQRVLEEARDSSVPLVERLKFLSICSSNLDEFFTVRVAGLIEQRDEGVMDVPSDGMPAGEQLARISDRVQAMTEMMSSTFLDDLLPRLAAEGVELADVRELEAGERARLRRFFFQEVFPILTPLAIDPGHPFPHVPSESLHLVVMLRGERGGEPVFAVIRVPRVLDRLVPVEGEGDVATYVLLDEVIAEHAGELFRGFRQEGAWPFHVVRNLDLSIDEEEAEDLLLTIEAEVRRRDRGRAVRLSVDSSAAPEAVDMLRKALSVDAEFVYRSDAPLAIHEMAKLKAPLVGRPELSDPPFVPARVAPLLHKDEIFDALSRGDVLLHHPYESFDPVVEFVEAAAADPNVLAIKQTVYRTSRDSPIIKALVRAAGNGKQVAALVEIKARFDEENNIVWARALEQAGVSVVYGLVGLKTHCKVTLVVRREGKRLRRYVHLGTGNYNPNTARLYTDLSLFTSRPELGEDATSLFNLLTSCTAPREWRKLVVAPLGLHETVLGLIHRETQFANAGRPARIIAKMNSLVDPDVIAALYRASQAGVEIDLIIRGICCLRPGLIGVSDNIRVRSVVDRFLEHSRVCFFEAGGQQEVYASSADWMPRNFHRRVEVMFPIESGSLKRRVLDDILGDALRDDVKARILQPDGSYERADGDTGMRSQTHGLKLASDAIEAASERERAERPFIVRPVRTRPTLGEGPTDEPSE